MMLKAKEHFLGLLIEEFYVLTFIGTIIVLFGKTVEKIAHLMGRKDGEKFQTC